MRPEAVSQTVEPVPTLAPQNSAVIPRRRSWAIFANRLSHRLGKHWLLVFSLGFGLLVGLPFLAPVLMHWGWTAPAKAIYSFYSFLCHQLPERSFFLFGPRLMLSIDDIQATHWNVTSIVILRRFIGTPELGWKVAWSDRMVAMFSSVLLFAWLWWPLRKRIRPLPIWGLVLLLLPMAVDGTAHMISDLAGLGQGFRDSNVWLAALTANQLPATFYAGDAIGSFNSVMRLLTGLLFGMGIVMFGFPYLYRYFRDEAAYLEAKFTRAGITL